MADIKLHPALRAQLEEQLRIWHRVLAGDDIVNVPLADPIYRADTAARAATCGLTVEQMHKRGVEGAKAEAAAMVPLIIQLLATC